MDSSEYNGESRLRRSALRLRGLASPLGPIQQRWSKSGLTTTGTTKRRGDEGGGRAVVMSSLIVTCSHSENERPRGREREREGEEQRGEGEHRYSFESIQAGQVCRVRAVNAQYQSRAREIIVACAKIKFIRKTVDIVRARTKSRVLSAPPLPRARPRSERT